MNDDINKQAELNETAWYLEQEKKTEDTLNHLRHVMGTFRTDKDPTFHFMEGYLSGIKTMYRKFHA